jgi:hypothetical protein
MLEDVAHNYINQSEQVIRAFNMGSILAGATLAALTTSSKSEIQRGSYLALISLVTLGIAVTQLAWLWGTQAMAAGYLWTLMSLDLLASFAAGIALCRLAMARARDATGRPGYALLAFIPIANLFLVFGRSAKSESPNRKPLPALLRGFPGLITCIVATGAAVTVAASLSVLQKQQAENIEDQPLSQLAAVESMLRTKGVSGTLKAIASQASLPVAIDNVTKLTRVEAEGSQLRRTFVVSATNVSMTVDMRTRVQNAVCASPFFVALLRSGASVREMYIKPDGTQIGVYLITRDSCGL